MSNLRHSSEGWNLSFFGFVPQEKRDPSLRWGDDMGGRGSE